MDKTGKILLKAAELIEQRGWCKGRWVDARGHMCVEGAILCSGGGASKEATLALRQLARTLGVWKDIPVIWNDTYASTKDEVIDVLVAAAYWEE